MIVESHSGCRWLYQRRTTNRWEALCFNDLGMRLSNQLSFSRITDCTFTWLNVNSWNYWSIFFFFLQLWCRLVMWNTLRIYLNCLHPFWWFSLWPLFLFTDAACWHMLFFFCHTNMRDCIKMIMARDEVSVMFFWPKRRGGSFIHDHYNYNPCCCCCCCCPCSPAWSSCQMCGWLGTRGGSYEKLSARVVKSPPWKHNAGPDFKAITLLSNVQNVHTDNQRWCWGAGRGQGWLCQAL